MARQYSRWQQGHPSVESFQAEITKLREAQIRHEKQRKEDLAHALEPATTSDGTPRRGRGKHRRTQGRRAVAELGGDGVGLLRSEFLFMERAAAPSEDEQSEMYKAIAEAVGPDKPSSSAPLMSVETSRSPTCRSEGGQSVPRRARNPRRTRPP